MAETKIRVDMTEYPIAPERKSIDYLKSYKGWVYSAIRLIAETESTVEIKLYKMDSGGDDVEEVTDAPCLDVLRYVNDTMTMPQLIDITEVYMSLLGEAVWYLLRKNGEPVAIIPLRPDWVDVVPDGRGGIKEYLYKTGGTFSDIPLKPEDVLFFKNFDPTNLYRGYSEVRASAMEIDIDGYSDEWNRNFFYNSAMPSLFLSTGANLTPEQKKRFVAKFQSGHGGVKNAHKVAFMSGGELKVTPVSANLQELDFQASKDRIRDKILAGFHISKSNIGMTDDVNRANSEAMEIRFMKLVVKPRLVKLVNYLNEFYLPQFSNTEGLFFNFVDPVGIDQTMLLKKLETASKEGWMSVNEIRQELELDSVDGGDYIYKPLNIMPIANTEGGEVPVTQPVQDNNGSDNNNSNNSSNNNSDGNNDNNKKQGLFSMFKKKEIKKEQSYTMLKTTVKRKKLINKLVAPIPQRSHMRKKQDLLYKEIGSAIKDLATQLQIKSRKDGMVVGMGDKMSSVITTSDDQIEYVKAFASRLQLQERLMMDMTKKLANTQEDIVISNVKKHQLALDNGKPLQASTFLFSQKSENARMYKSYAPFLLAVARQFGDETLREIMKSENIENVKGFDSGVQLVQDFLRDLGTDFVNEINQTTREDLIKTITEGIKNNESADDIVNRIIVVYDGLREWRNELIARTQVLQAANFGTWASYTQSEGIVVGKQWFSAEDGNVRPDHQSANRQVREVLDPFLVGGKKMQYPLDPAGGADQICNCRCTTLPITRTQLRSMQLDNMEIKNRIYDEIYYKLYNKLKDIELQEKEQRLKELDNNIVNAKDSFIEAINEHIENDKFLLEKNKKNAIIIQTENEIRQKEIEAINKQKATIAKEKVAKTETRLKDTIDAFEAVNEKKREVEVKVAQLRIEEMNIQERINKTVGGVVEKTKLLLKRIGKHN